MQRQTATTEIERMIMAAIMIDLLSSMSLFSHFFLVAFSTTPPVLSSSTAGAAGATAPITHSPQFLIPLSQSKAFFS